MREYCFRHALLLSVVCLLFSCSDTRESELVIQSCLDQNGDLLPPGVTVSVDGLSEIWSGSPLRFPIKVDGPVRLVNVKAGAGNGYVYNSKSQYAVRPDMPTTVRLRFFRPYRVTIEAADPDSPPLSDADIFANGHHIAKTDTRGRFVWTIDSPDTHAGIARAGARFDIRLVQGDAQAVAAPVILAKEQFSYAAEVLDQDRIAPYYSFAAEAAMAARESTDTPSPQTETPPPRPPRATTPPASSTTDDPTAPVTEARPRPPSFEQAPEEPGDVPAALAPLTPTPPPAEPDPGIPSALQQGDQAFATGRFEDAKRIYGTIPPGSPDFKRARQKLGEIHLETKNYEGAVAAFEEIIRQDPSEYAAYNNLAAVYLATESYSEALANLDKVLARKHLIPKNKRRHAELEVRYNRAAIYYVQFQNERDVITKKEQGLLAMSVVQDFIDRVPSGDAAFEDKQHEMVDKLDDIRQWVRGH